MLYLKQKCFLGAHHRPLAVCLWLQYASRLFNYRNWACCPHSRSMPQGSATWHNQCIWGLKKFNFTNSIKRVGNCLRNLLSKPLKYNYENLLMFSNANRIIIWLIFKAGISITLYFFPCHFLFTFPSLVVSLDVQCSLKAHMFKVWSPAHRTTGGWPNLQEGEPSGRKWGQWGAGCL